jgi:hypothetical protein
VVFDVVGRIPVAGERNWWMFRVNKTELWLVVW